MAEADVRRHYAREGLLEAVLESLRAAGKDVEALSPEDLAPLDQFHLGGADATLELAALAGLREGQRVLDLGGGLGGPARLLAARFGVEVSVVDLSPGFCEAGRELTRRLRLSERVGFRCASALEPSEGGPYDRVWTQHGTMNIEDKAGLARAARAALAPGGLWALHEIMAGAGDVRFPVPWAREPGLSFLVPPEEFRALAEGAGFRVLAWEDLGARALEWARARLAAAGGTPPVSLGLLFGPLMKPMAFNVERNLAEGRIAVFRGLLEAVG